MRLLNHQQPVLQKGILRSAKLPPRFGLAAPANLISHFNPPAHVLNNILSDRQAQPCAAAVGPGGLIRFKNPFGHVLRNAFATILNREQDELVTHLAFSGMLVAVYFEREFPARYSGMASSLSVFNLCFLRGSTKWFRLRAAPVNVRCDCPSRSQT
jgi:hypothetical protein